MKKIIIIVMLSFTLLNACTSKIAYNNLDWLLYWYLDDYIDLDKQQKRVFDKKLELWLTWHRKSELNQYKAHLQQIQGELQTGAISTEQWSTHFDLAALHWYRVRDTISVDLAVMAEQISEDQINALFDTLEEQNVKRLKERAELSDEERASDSIENIQDRVKDWIGRLSKVQKNIIASRAAELQSNFSEWITYRRNIQNQTRLLLLQRHENTNFTADFLTIISHPEIYQSQIYIERSAHNKRVFTELLAQLSEGLSTKQMKKLNNELQALIEDIDDLVGE